MSNTYMVGGNTDETLVYKGKVESVPDDTTGYAPIKCRLQVVDGNRLTEGDLSDCYPLLPKHLSVYPKKGEYVYIITLAKGSPQQIRYFIGPVVDTYGQLNIAPDDQSETNAGIESNQLREPEKGIYPSRNHVSIQGRNNSDVVLKDQEILLRAGKYVIGDPFKFNSFDTGYIQIRYGQPELKKTKKEKKTQIVKLPVFDGFVTANLLLTIPLQLPYQVNLKFDDKDNKFLGKIFKSFSSEEEAISFIKETFIDLKKQGSTSKSLSLITDNFGNKVSISNCSNYKFISTDVPQLKDWNDLNPKTVTEEKIEQVEVEETIFTDSKGSGINVVASKINFISYGNDYGFKLLDPETTINAEQQLKINTDAQPIPYGYILNDFLSLIKTFVTTHVHAYPGLPPDPNYIVQQISDFNLESILNQNVRTA